MRTPLVLCPSCANHVRRDESACPFCSASLAERGGVSPALKGLVAMAAFAAVMAIAACAYGCPDAQCGAPQPDAGVSTDAARPDGG